MLVGCSGTGESEPKPKPSGGSGNSSSSGGSNTSGSPGLSGSPSMMGGATGATGGSSSEAGTGAVGGGSGDACSPLPDDCTANSADGSLPFASFDTETGFWLFANEEDAMGMTEPMPGANVVPEEILCPTSGLCGGTVTYAMHVSGGGYTTYGPSLSKDNVFPSTAMPGTFDGMPMDVSTYTGIQFWSRKGNAGSNAQIGITLNDDTSAPAAGLCDEAAIAGTPMSKACFDGFYAKVSATSSWKLHRIPFSMLKQQGFGNVSADAMFHPDKLYGVSFNLPMSTFDLWIGNVAFYK